MTQPKKPWAEKAFDWWMLNVVGAPLTFAQGRHWAWRFIALSMGWMWMVPVMVLSFPLALAAIMSMMWRELAEPKVSR